MTKWLYPIAGILMIAACTSQNSYQLTGTIEGISAEDIIFLEQRINKEYIQIDSATTRNGAFTFSGSVEMPDVYYISVPGRRGKALIFIENSEISFKAHADTLWMPVITGSAVQAEYDAFQATSREIYSKARELYPNYQEAEKAGDKETANKLADEIEAVYDQAQEFQKEYLEENPASYISPLIVQNLHYGKEADEIEALLAKLDLSLQNSSLVENVTRRLEVLKTVAIGMPAPDFKQNDPEGNPLSLSSLTGNYLLIDFWAAWCAPCRAENPNVVDAYKKYHEKGFDILGVSLDDSREKWMKAVEDDELAWYQVSDLKGWSNEVAALYGISSIPSNLLLDPEGMIVKKNLRGEDLHGVLEELLQE